MLALRNPFEINPHVTREFRKYLVWLSRVLQQKVIVIVLGRSIHLISSSQLLWFDKVYIVKHWTPVEICLLERPFTQLLVIIISGLCTIFPLVELYQQSKNSVDFDFDKVLTTLHYALSPLGIWKLRICQNDDFGSHFIKLELFQMEIFGCYLLCSFAFNSYLGTS